MSVSVSPSICLSIGLKYEGCNNNLCHYAYSKWWTLLPFMYAAASHKPTIAIVVVKTTG